MGRYRPRQCFNTNDYEFIIEVDLQLESFREYIKLTEDLIEVELKQKLIKYDTFLEEEDKEIVKEFYDFADHEVKRQAHQLFFDSLFISLYSFLERKMFQLCKIAEAGHQIKVKDLGDKGIKQYRTYITKVLNIDLETVHSQWTGFQKYNTLRNQLVHEPTYTVDIKNKTKINKLKSIQGLVIKERGDVIEFEISDKKLLMDFCKDIGIFLKHIHCEQL